jgi:protein-S-isoprenylcysteine O-methyltransferase Ste14
MSDKSRYHPNDPRSEASKKRDLISRGDYTKTPLGTSLFVALRSIDPFIQYSILAHGVGASLLHRVGLRTLPAGIPARSGISMIDPLQLSPYRIILLGMTVGSMLKQNYWAVALSGEPMSVKNAFIVCTFNTIMNGINNYGFLLSANFASSSSSFPQPSLIVGSTLYVVGLLTELIAEMQRKRFKADPKNKGKPYTEGLWKYARHINYGAYTVWRAGYALAAGGWVLGAAIAAFFFSDFATRGVPILNEYCEKRYGADWEQFKKQTRYRLIPGIY